MRYEDGSGLGSPESNHEPIARADVDTLPPGSFGPATGNAISGAGTSSGAAGADSLGAASATIVEVHGAGGATTGSDGSFQALGQYGALSIDAQGEFNYVRNAGTPDGVKDVFQYTLANSAGLTSSTTLTIDIEQVAAAAAGQAVVALPAGVEMSDIHVNGRDLVIDMPDGTQMVIPNGAVFVPQIAIGDVEVPSSNLAALLIDSEPQPAAGPPQSSGGNFADIVPGLDPGAPLGDLIPPTELTYTPPEFQEVNQFENTKPTVLIETPDNPAGLVNAIDSVDESGLPARTVDGVAEPAGTLAPQDIESTTGTIAFTAQDGLDSVSINDVVVASVGQQIAGAHGTLTITSIDLVSGEIGYSYTATDNTTDGTDDFENFTVIVTDNDGDTATGTLHINIADDEPIALNDTDSTDLVTHVATGNVMTGADTTSGAAGADTVGADDASLTAVSSNNTGASDSSFNESGDLIVEGEFGTLTIKADGSYVYTAHQDAPGGSSEVFTYTLTDGDGDPAQATLTITNPDHTPAVGENAAVQLDDDALAGGNAGGVGDDPDSAHTTGVLSGSGGDGALGFALTEDGAPDGFSYSLQDNGDLWVMQGATHVVTIAVDSATGAYTVTQVAAIDHPVGDAENNVEFNLSYTVTDSDGDPATGHLTVNVDDDSPVARNDTDSLGSDGHAAGNVITGAGTTTGVGGADSFGADGPGQLTGVSSNGTGQSDTSFDSDGNLIVHGSFGTLTIDANGDYTYVRDANSSEAGSEVFTYTIVDGDGDTTTATLTIAVPNVDSTPQIGEAANLTVDEDGLPLGNSDNGGTLPSIEQDHGGSVTDSNTVNVDYGNDVPADLAGAIALVDSAGLDTQLTQGGEPITFSLIGGDLVGQVNGAGPAVVTISLTTAVAGSGGNVTYGYAVTLAGQVDQTLGDNNESGITLSGVQFQVTDSDGDHAAAPGSFDVTIYDDVPSAEAITVTQSPEDATVVVDLNGHFTAGADGVDLHDVTYNVTSGNAAELSYDGDTGQFTYNPVDGETGDVVFTYTIVDSDGDQATQTVTIHLADDSVPQIGEAANLTVDEDGLPLGNSDNGGTLPSIEQDHGGSVTDSNTVNVDYGNDVPADLAGAIALVDSAGLDTQLTQGGEPITFSLIGGDLVGQVNGAGPAVVTISLTTAVAGSGGNVTYGYAVTLAGQVDQTLGDNNESGITLSGVQFQVTDSDGDHAAAPGSFDVTIYDDVPSAVADTNNVDEGGTLTVNAAAGVLHNDVPGADGYASGGGVTGVATGSDTSVVVSGDVGTAVTGAYGTLTLYADGHYTYQADPNSVSPDGAVDHFVYTITDGDGDASTTTLDITVDNVDQTPTGGTVNAFVDDEGLTGGNLGLVADGDINANSGEVGTGTSSEAVWTGTLAGSGGDAPISFLFDQSLDGTAVTGGVGTEAATYSVSLDGLTLTASGDRGTIFTVHIDDTTTGAYTLTLNDNVLNTFGDNVEDSATVDIPYTVKDVDGSTAAGTIHATFNDDMPVAFTPDIANVDNEAGPESAPIAVHFAASAGADGVGDIVFNVADDTQVTDTDGNALQFFSEDIFFQNVGTDGHVIEARTADGDLAFTMTLDPGGDSYTIDLEGPIYNIDQFGFTNLTGVHGGNVNYVALGTSATGSGTDLEDILISGSDTVNTNANNIGIGSGQNIEGSETIVFEFKSNIAIDNSSPTGFSDDGFYSINEYTQEFDVVSGAPHNTAGFTMTVENALPGGDPSNVTVTVYDGDPEAGGTVVTSFTNASGNSVVVADGYVEEGFYIQVTSSDPFTSVEYSNNTGDPYKLGVIEVQTVNTLDPFDFNVPITGTDSDGDAINSTIDVHLIPAAPVTPFAATTFSLSTNSLTSSNLVSSNDNDGQKQGGTHTMVLTAALAAAGLSTAHAASAHGSDNPLGNHENHMSDKAAGGNLAPLMADRHEGHDPVGNGLETAKGGQHEAVVSSTPLHTDQAQSQHHSGGDHHQAAQTELLHATAGAAHDGATHVAQFAAQGVIMPSAEQLATLEASAEGAKPSVEDHGGQHNQVVAKVLADALHGGGHGHSIDHLLDAAHGSHGHANPVLEALATHGGGAVPFGHMSFAASFPGGHGVHMMDAMVVHQDAPPTHG